MTASRLPLAIVLFATSACIWAAEASSQLPALFGVRIGETLPKSTTARWVEHPGGEGAGIGMYEFQLDTQFTPFVRGRVQVTPKGKKVYLIDGSVELSDESKCIVELGKQRAKFEALFGKSFRQDQENDPGSLTMSVGSETVNFDCFGGILVLTATEESMREGALEELLDQ
jgi:hypothetical protein